MEDKVIGMQAMMVMIDQMSNVVVDSDVEEDWVEEDGIH